MTTSGKSMLELLFAEQIRGPFAPSTIGVGVRFTDPAMLGVRVTLPAPERQYRFHPKRKWAFDFAWPQPGRLFHPNHIQKPIAVEIEGGSWVQGRHIRPSGFEEDCEKYGEATILGWRVLRVTSHMVEDGRAIAMLRRLFDA